MSGQVPPSIIRGTYLVAVILAVSVGLALNVLTAAVVFGALNTTFGTLSENATQILTGWGGGIIGIVGAIVGYETGAKHGRHES